MRECSENTVGVTDPFPPSRLQSTIHDNLLTSMRTVINGMAKLSITLANPGNEVSRLLAINLTCSTCLPCLLRFWIILLSLQFCLCCFVWPLVCSFLIGRSPLTFESSPSIYTLLHVTCVSFDALKWTGCLCRGGTSSNCDQLCGRMP